MDGFEGGGVKTPPYRLKYCLGAATTKAAGEQAPALPVEAMFGCDDNKDGGVKTPPYGVWCASVASAPYVFK